MEKKTDTTDYETPLIEDHGDLTELTAAASTGGYFDGHYVTEAGQPVTGTLQTSP